MTEKLSADWHRAATIWASSTATLFVLFNLALRQIHFQADRDGGLRRQLWGVAERNTFALANGARANTGFETITLPGEVALFKEQPAGGALG